MYAGLTVIRKPCLTDLCGLESCEVRRVLDFHVTLKVKLYYSVFLGRKRVSLHLNLDKNEFVTEQPDDLLNF